MDRRLLITLLLVALSTLAAGQTDYGPRGISTSLPMAAPAAPPVITPSSNTIPVSPGVTPLVITQPLTTIPTVQAVPPPIEPSPNERMANGLRYVYAANNEGAEPPRGRGVNNATSVVSDGADGRSLGEVAREKRRCTPKVSGYTFTNDDFGRVASSNDTSGLPTLVKNVCPQ